MFTSIAVSIFATISASICSDASASFSRLSVTSASSSLTSGFGFGCVLGFCARRAVLNSGLISRVGLGLVMLPNNADRSANVGLIGEGGLLELSCNELRVKKAEGLK